MRDDRRTFRTTSWTAIPHLFPGAMFILPLALVQPALGQAGGGSAAPAPTQGADAKKSITAAGKETFTVQFQDTDILQALQMLSIQGQKNIIAGKGVSGTVTANLFDVTVQEALDVILKANDLRYEEVGNFIYVYTRSDWEAMQQARRKKESRRFTLEYLSAKDANEFVQPLISEVGKVSFMGQTEKGVKADVSNAGEDSWAFQAMLVVNDYPENLQAIADFLAEVDTPPQQVSVESTIVSTRVNEDNAFGIDFSVIGDIDFADLTNPLAAVNNLIAGGNTPGTKATDELGFQPADNRAAAGSTSVGRTSQAGGLKIGVISKNVSAFLRVLDEVTDTMILARPRVMALNRQRSHILVGEKVGYLSTTQTETTATQTVQYLDTGIKLIFRPFISKDGSIRMELAPSVSEATLRQVTTDAGGGMVIPDEKTNEVTTNVRVKDGQTLVLGGLFQEKTTISRRQVPLLGDVPILGNAFKGQDDKLERNEIMFLITPTIMHDSLIAKVGDEANDFAEAVRVGARESLLPFSREAMSSSHNQQAIDALAKGDTEKALYHTENSLRINKNQPEMIRLREQLDKAKPSRVFERDMYKRIGEKRVQLEQERNAEIAAATAAAQPPATDPLARPASVNPTAPAAQTSAAAEEPMVEETVAPEQPMGTEPETPTQPESQGQTGIDENFEGEAADGSTALLPQGSEMDGEYFPSTSEVIDSILATPVVPLGDETLDPNCEADEHQADVDQAALANASTSSLDQVAQQPIVTTPIAQTSPTQLAQQWKPFSLLAFLDRQYGMPAIGFTNLVANGFKSNATVASRSAVTIQAPSDAPTEIAEVQDGAEEIDPMNSQFPNDNK
jgi:type IV pilus assembly protein PilQ